MRNHKPKKKKKIKIAYLHTEPQTSERERSAKISKCYRLNAMAPQNSHVKTITPNIMILRGENLGIQLCFKHGAHGWY